MGFNDSLQICFQFFIKVVAELGDFTVRKKIQSNSKGPVKIWWSFFRFYIWSNYKLEMILWYICYCVILIEDYLQCNSLGDVAYFILWIWTVNNTTFLLCLCFQFNGQRITQFLVSLYIYASNIFISIVNVYGQRITQFFFSLILLCISLGLCILLPWLRHITVLSV